MEVCGKGHAEIVFGALGCPLCEALGSCEDRRQQGLRDERKIMELEHDVEVKEYEIARLRKVLDKSQ